MDRVSLVLLVSILTFTMVGALGRVLAGGSKPSGRMIKRASAMAAATARARAGTAPVKGRRRQMLKTLRGQTKAQVKATQSIEAQIQQAGLKITPRNFIILSAGVGLGVLLLALSLKVKLLLALGLGFAAGFGLPRWVLGNLVKRRLKAFTEAFPDAIDIIVRGIRSGLPLNDCLKIIGHECPEPLAGEFRRLVETMSLGGTVEMALAQMSARIPTQELRFFTVVLSIQQKAGGNLGEALGNLSSVLRARKLMREKIKALSSEATASAFIIGSMPPAVIILISVTSPAYMSLMFTVPKGQLMLLGGLIWMSLGIFVMRRMINFQI
ncbi:MAG: type II secretion system F family protein [Caulobacteraceae bacterium]|nr:type II secretion system F family protein [Caulobacteraceae bacterium]